jgi:uncharacterized protein
VFKSFIAFVLFTSCLLVAAPSQALVAQESKSDSKPNNGEVWYSELDAGPRVFRFVIRTKQSDAGSVVAQLMSLDEGGAVFELNNAVIDKDNLDFTLKATKAKYDSKVSEDGTKATGKWSQGGANLDLIFEKMSAPPVDNPEEVWLGTMSAGFQKLEMQVRVYADKDGKQKAFVDSLSQNASGFKADIATDGKKVTINSAALGAKYTGEKNDDGTEIKGKWSQGIPLALDLKRVEKVAEPKRPAPNRPQTPKAPFPYDIEEVTFRNESDGTILAGTITRPKTGGPFPVAILISGSGPQDRDETILDHKPFWVIADHLTRNGIAVLRFDDRGVGKSTGKFEKATTEDFAGDVTNAINYLKTAKSIDPKRIGLIGHSEGGLVSTLVAGKNDEVAWVILMASPGVNGEQILYSQGQLIIAAEGGSEDAMKRQRLLQERVFAKANSIETTNNIEPFVASIVDEIVAIAKESEPKSEADSDPEKTKAREEAGRKVLTELVRANLKAMNDPWFRFFAKYEPAADLQKIKCPVLAINGEKDVQVDPKLNLPKIESAVQAGGNKNVTVMALPGLNHLFQTCKSGGISEYQSIEETIAPAALKVMTDWLKTNASSAK